MTVKVEIIGIEQLREQMKKFPDKVVTRVINKGVRKASATLRTALRRGAYAAPLVVGYRKTNKLRQSLRSIVGKKPANRGKAWVGLKKIPGQGQSLNYYSTLEYGRKGGKPLRPFFFKTWAAQRGPVGRVLVEETGKALAYEAGKAYAKSKGRR
jgi:hypothetical protein